MLSGREPTQPFLRPLLVVFSSPGLYDEPGMAQVEKPMLVQAFVPEATVERLDVRVLVRLARLDQTQLYIVFVRPLQHGSAGELLSVVGPNDLWVTTGQTDSVERTDQVVTADRMLGMSSDALRRAVIDDAEDLESAPASDPVEDEIHRPDFVGSCRTPQWLAIGDRYLLSPTPLDL